MDKHESARAVKKAELIDNLKRLYPGVVSTPSCQMCVCWHLDSCVYLTDYLPLWLWIIDRIYSIWMWLAAVECDLQLLTYNVSGPQLVSHNVTNIGEVFDVTSVFCALIIFCRNWTIMQLKGTAMELKKIGSRPSDHYFRSVCWFVCLFVCLCRVFLSRLWSDFDQTRTYVICLGLVVSPRI